MNMQLKHWWLCALGGAVLLSTVCTAQELDQNTYYVHKTQGVGTWLPALQFGQVKFENGKAETIKGALVAKPATKETENDVLHLKWTPKNVQNEWGSQNENIYWYTVSNSATSIDLSSIKDDAALVFDIRIIKPPKDLVQLAMESSWDYKSRSEIALKAPFKKLPKNKWISFPVPLKCFESDKFDFSKVTSVFMLHTADKMEIELGDIRLAAFPRDQVKCAAK